MNSNSSKIPPGAHENLKRLRIVGTFPRRTQHHAYPFLSTAAPSRPDRRDASVTMPAVTRPGRVTLPRHRDRRARGTAAVRSCRSSYFPAEPHTLSTPITGGALTDVRQSDGERLDGSRVRPRCDSGRYFLLGVRATGACGWSGTNSWFPGRLCRPQFPKGGSGGAAAAVTAVGDLRPDRQK